MNWNNNDDPRIAHPERLVHTGALYQVDTTVSAAQRRTWRIVAGLVALTLAVIAIVIVTGGK